MKSKRRAKIHIWLRFFALLFLITGLIMLAYKFGFIPLSKEEYGALKNRLHGFLKRLGPFAFVGFILLQAAQVIVAPVPGEVTGLLGGMLYGPLLGVILSTIGLTIGSYIAFALSRFFGRPLVEKFVNKRTMKRFDYLLHHKGAFLVFLLFLIPGFPKDSLCYILGIGHLSTAEFLVIGGTGRLFGTILLTLGGTYIRHHQYGRFFILAGIAIIVVFIAMAYRDKLERTFRKWHIISYRKKKAKKAREKQVSSGSKMLKELNQKDSD